MTLKQNLYSFKTSNIPICQCNIVKLFFDKFLRACLQLPKTTHKVSWVTPIKMSPIDFFGALGPDKKYLSNWVNNPKHTIRERRNH